MDTARERAEKLAAKAPLLRAKAKELTGVSIENSLTEHLQLERHGIADSMATEDLRNGVAAFFGGEKPEFDGPLNAPAMTRSAAVSGVESSQPLPQERTSHEEGLPPSSSSPWPPSHSSPAAAATTRRRHRDATTAAETTAESEGAAAAEAAARPRRDRSRPGHRPRLHDQTKRSDRSRAR